MNCDFCGEELIDKGLLITTGAVEKRWACSDCYIKALIEGRADIVHSWGYEKEEAKEEPVELEESDKGDESHSPTFLGKEIKLDGETEEKV